MSPEGISMFYAAGDPDTALAELRPRTFPRAATVATWVTAHEFPYLDLVDITIPSTFDMTGRVRRPWLGFLSRFAAELAKPIDIDAGPIDYVPTQIFTEYVRHVLVDVDATPLRGIRYGSATRLGGISRVLFVDPSGCCETGPGGDAGPASWVGLDVGSIRRFDPGWRER